MVKPSSAPTAVAAAAAPRWFDSDSARTVAGILALCAGLLALANIGRHLRVYRGGVHERSTMRLLLVVPLYGLVSFLSLLIKGEATLYLDTVRDVYEAYVVHLFLALIVAYAGGQARLVHALALRPPLAHPWPGSRRCVAPMRLGAPFVRRCAQGTLQFVVVKPAMAALSLSMLAAGQYKSDAYQWVLLVVYNISYTVALYALLCLYLAARQVVHGHNIVWKFVAVKSVVFLTYWQSLAVAALPGVSTEDANRLNDFVLCVEMLGFAALHWKAFPPHRAARGAFTLEEEVDAMDGGRTRARADEMAAVQAAAATDGRGGGGGGGGRAYRPAHPPGREGAIAAAVASLEATAAPPADGRRGSHPAAPPAAAAGFAGDVAAIGGARRNTSPSAFRARGQAALQQLRDVKTRVAQKLGREKDAALQTMKNIGEVLSTQDLRNDLRQNVFQRARPGEEEGRGLALLGDGQEMTELAGEQAEAPAAAEYAPPPLPAAGGELSEV